MWYSGQIILLLGAFLLMAGFFWALQQNRAKVEKIKQQLDDLKNRMVSIQSSNISQGKSICRLNAEVKTLLAQRQHMEEHTKMANKAYQQAAKMLSMGASPDDIMDCCELTRGEVQLIAQLQRSEDGSRMH